MSGIAMRQEGQASIEIVAVLPILAVVALAAGQLLAAGQARELAGNAAQAGAMAVAQGGDPVRAARAALPRERAGDAAIVVRGRTVIVTLPPAGPLTVGRLLVARAQATAGP